VARGKHREQRRLRGRLQDVSLQQARHLRHGALFAVGAERQRAALFVGPTKLESGFACGSTP
jgi:hypothetical protein